MKLSYYHNEKIETATYNGKINGYLVGYQSDYDLPWIVLSKSDIRPIILASFLSQDDMEIMMHADLDYHAAL